MPDAVCVQNLVKIYSKKKWFYATSRPTVAVNHLNFTIGHGDAVAFLGRNGAGKSTTIKLLCGIITPTQGCCRILGNRAGSMQANQHLGIIFGTRSQLWMHLTIQQSFEISAEIYGVTGKEKQQLITQLAKTFEINDLRNRTAKSLSLGQRMRCELVMALLHYPKILLADEPTIGLDVVAKNHFREIINNWRRHHNLTLLLTSHDCDDVESLCDRSLLIEKGEIQYEGSLQGLKGKLADVRHIIVTLRTRYLNFQFDENHIRGRKIDDYRWCFEINNQQIAMTEAIQKIITHLNNEIVDIKIEDISLE
jgi:ABC-2 type transport system ATP-binding protein